MKPEAVRAHLADRSVLPEAWKSLGILDVRIQKDFFGNVEGVDTVHLALDALAHSLTRMFAYPEGPEEWPKIADVLAFLTARECIDTKAVTLLTHVREGIQKSTYRGLKDSDIEPLEANRKALYSHLEALLSLVEGMPPDG